MFMLKICRCCDAIIGELDREDLRSHSDPTLEVMGNVVFALCPRCMQELDINTRAYIH
ncbi:MAG: hypothetical protein ACOX3R_10105 [Desulfitobacteriia bacterium]